MVKALIGRLILWLILSMPVGIAAGALVSIYFGQGHQIDSFTSGANGGLTGAWLGLFGGVGAAVTNTVSRGRIRSAGGSECITGAIVSYGLIGVSLVLVWAFS